MILYDPRVPALAREFTGRRQHVIVPSGHTKTRLILFNEQLRAMIVSMAWHLEHHYELDFLVTGIFRSWEKQDEFYPIAAEKYGLGPRPGKKMSPHQLGRADDGIVVGEGLEIGGSLYNEAMDWAEDWLNSTFPYAWNNKSRKWLKFKSAWRHVHTVKGVKKGDHLHVQISW